MSDKKQLLTESEMRRFMTLANIPVLGRETVKETMVPPGIEREGSPQEEAMAEEAPAEMPMGDEMPAEQAPEMGGEEAELSPELQKKVLQAVADALKIEIDISDEAEGAGEEMPDMELAADDEQGEEEAEEGEEESGEEDEEEADEEEMQEGKKADSEEEEETEEESKKLDESKIIDMVLARVTARLVEEAKKAKKGGKKAAEKMKKMKAAKDEKEKLEEANAAAPKSTMSNAAKAGVAKGAGKADKGTWGVTSKVHDKEWKEGKNTKGSDELETLAASAEHTVTHGKKNLATLGGNKKK